VVLVKCRLEGAESVRRVTCGHSGTLSSVLVRSQSSLVIIVKASMRHKMALVLWSPKWRCVCYRVCMGTPFKGTESVRRVTAVTRAVFLSAGWAMLDQTRFRLIDHPVPQVADGAVAGGGGPRLLLGRVTYCSHPFVKDALCAVSAC
jgi:hypothetical protein